MALELFADSDTCCNKCMPADCIYNCLECRGPRFSKTCLLREHVARPLHRVQVSLLVCYIIAVSSCSVDLY
jgi:hypothetical protein